MEKGKTMMIVIIVLLVILIVTIAGVSYYTFKKINTPEDPNAAKTVATGKVLEPIEITVVELADPIAVNLAVGADGAQHSASVEVAIGIDNTDKKESPVVVDLITNQEVVVRDVVISVLRSKNIEQISEPDSQEAIKQEILEKLRLEFNTNLIYNVRFGTFYYD